MKINKIVKHARISRPVLVLKIKGKNLIITYNSLKIKNQGIYTMQN